MSIQTKKKVNDEGRFLELSLANNARELQLTLARGTVARTERVAAGVVLDRDADGVALRIRVTSLKKPWTTNAFLTPVIVCELDGCSEQTLPDGGKMYDLGIGNGLRKAALYWEASPPRRGVPENPAQRRKRAADQGIDEFQAFIRDAFLIPELRKKHNGLYKRFVDAVRKPLRRKP
jgi:hypothetical protein